MTNSDMPDSYRGWSVSFDRTCPDIDSTWQAIAPDFDPERTHPLTYTRAADLDRLMSNIDEKIEERELRRLYNARSIALGTLASIIEDRDCCLVSKTIARAAMKDIVRVTYQPLSGLAADMSAVTPDGMGHGAQQWTKAELDEWARSWTRTPQTVLKAFIDAGFCSDEAPVRKISRLLRQPSTARQARGGDNG